ncbi:MAG: D-tyrosyl-tRNA(Tyr) deacylase [Elusimicrobia bacterium]|nr:D-tyrosyl-tRNA(Tyr) deacylase [Elusimicrobiota bacterium]
MRALIQRVKGASVEIPDSRSSISLGLLVLLGVKKGDGREEAEYLADKTLNLRIFEKSSGRMEYSVKDIKGEILVVSQFTLYGDTRRGRRPSFSEAAEPSLAMELFEYYIECLKASSLTVKKGYFGQHMLLNIENDGPVTLMIEKSK